MIDEDVNACGQNRQDRGHNRSNCIVTENGHNHTEDTDREVVDQHLEACRHMTIHCLVKLFDDPACERAHNHCAHQHRLTGDNAAVRAGGCHACDTAHDCDCTHDATAFAADHLTALRSNQNRNEEVQHERLNGCKLRVRNPAGLNEQGGNKAPCNEGANVRHDHAG